MNHILLCQIQQKLQQSKKLQQKNVQRSMMFERALGYHRTSATMLCIQVSMIASNIINSNTCLTIMFCFVVVSYQPQYGFETDDDNEESYNHDVKQSQENPQEESQEALMMQPQPLPRAL